MASPAEVFEELRQAHARGDADAAVALYAPDAVYYDAGNVAHRGRDEIRNALVSTFTRRGPVEIDVKRQVTADGSVLTECTRSFTEGGRRFTGVPGAVVIEVGPEGIVYHRDYQ